MTGAGRYTLFGVYVSEPVYQELSDRIYEAAGVIDLESYFDPSESSLPAGDPGAEATDELLTAVVESFATLYDQADFEAANSVDSDSFVLVHLAGDPETVASARDLFRAAGTIQRADLRTVQTAILEAYLAGHSADAVDR